MADPTNVNISNRSHELAAERGSNNGSALTADDETTTFVASVSHELRSPVHAILGLAELLGQSDLNNSDMKLVKAITREAGVLRVLLDDLLDLSKIQAGKLELKEEVFSPARLASEVQEILLEAATDKGLEFKVDIAPQTPINVIGDGHRIRQVILNLASNAIRYTDSGSVTLDVKSTEKGTLKFQVVDTGPGIVPEKLATLFDAFQQTHDGRVGTGLGLTVASNLAALLHGNIDVSSEVGTGSTFTFETPFKPADRREDDKVSEITQSTSGRILIVEDGEVNRLLAVTQLERLGYESAIAVDGGEGIEKALGEHFDAILMDWHLPVYDGLEATKQIRDAGGWGAKVPIIAVTASAMQGNRDICIEAGMNDFLAKPVTLDDLRVVLKKWVKNEEPINDNSVADTRPDQSPQEQDMPPDGTLLDKHAVDQLLGELDDKVVGSTLIESFQEELAEQRNHLLTFGNQLNLTEQDAADMECQEGIVSAAMLAAHTLRSTAPLVGSRLIGDKCTQLEALIKQNDLDKKTQDLANEVAGFLKRAIDELEQRKQA